MAINSGELAGIASEGRIQLLFHSLFRMNLRFWSLQGTILMVLYSRTILDTFFFGLSLNFHDILSAVSVFNVGTAE